eukprot:PITA_02170
MHCCHEYGHLARDCPLGKRRRGAQLKVEWEVLTDLSKSQKKEEGSKKDHRNEDPSTRSAEGTQRKVGSSDHRTDAQPRRVPTEVESAGFSEKPGLGMQSPSCMLNKITASCNDEIEGNTIMAPILEDHPQILESVPEAFPSSNLISEVPSKYDLGTGVFAVTRHYNLRSLHKTPAHKIDMQESVGGLSSETSRGTSKKGRGRKSFLSKAQVKAKGLASKPKKLALKDLITRHHPDVVFLQETLGKGSEIEFSLRSFLPGWSFSALDATGHSGGLAIGFKDGSFKIQNSWGLSHVLGMEVLSAEFDQPLLFINVYGPCQGRVPFWNNFLSKEFLLNKNLIIGGDLNFSLGIAEAWGPSAREDSLTDFFSKALQNAKLIDVNIIKAKPTWRNRRTGEGRVVKRLDRYLINEKMAAYIPLLRQWVGDGGNSDHFPIFLEFSKPPAKPATPFKFNASWLQEESYQQLFKNTWRHLDSNSQVSKGGHFMENLKRLKRATIAWAAERRRKQNEELVKIKEALGILEDPDSDAYVSQESKEKVLTLERSKAKILLDKEEEWRLKSRAIWLKAGDENTKFFHNYAKGRKNANTIWKMRDPEGREVSSFEAISSLGKNHFQTLFTAPGGISLAEIIRTAQAFPRFVEEEDADLLFRAVEKEEVERIIKAMPRDKSPGPDGWTIELFSHFFDLIGDELIEVVEESRKKGEIYSPFNTTFIALIPKTENPVSFDDFRPISLCNTIYKIIAKVIAVRLKPILSECISNEQFGFLDGRQIHEAIGVAQETIHNIRQAKKKGAVLKIDLSKAYDRIDWSYLRLLLTHLGFKVEFINWIMGCITNINFVVLINGAASQFFKSQRGLRQGCPLSPLLFLLAAEGLRRLILKAKQSGMLTGLEVAVNLFISHLLFVDDILLFLNGNLPEVKVLKDIIDLFLKATGLQINPRKSHFILEGFTRHEAFAITSILPFETTQMDMPFKYLGFWLKPSSYRNQDWHWLVAKIEQRISHWSFKWLSRAGRLTLVNSVLQAIPVFWAALTWIPRGIIHKIKQICSRFLWSGSKESSMLPWVAWDKIARPKEWGGWGVKQLADFCQSLAAKSGWRIVEAENLWTRVVKRKYIDPTPIENWIRSPNKKGRNCSVIWKATLDAFKIIERGLAWKVGNGECVRIGKDPWVGCNEHYVLSPGLLEQLDSKGIKMLQQIENPGLSSIWAQGWKLAEHLDLDVLWRDEWNVFIQELNRSNVRLKDAPDSLVWAHAETGRYSPKAGYDFLMSRKGWEAPVWWAKSLFKLKCPKKARIFFWCALKNKIPTWDILQARFQLGPSRCPLCNDASESISHLFVSCHFTKSVWEESFKLLKCTGKWEGENLSNAWEYWWAHYPEKNM